MYSEEDLEQAVRAGIFTAASVHAFRAHIAEAQRSPLADDEGFRLVTGFNDIFVVIACALLLISVGLIGGTVAAQSGAALVSITSWGLAEFFTRKRRMALPSIMLLLTFVGGIISIGVITAQEQAGVVGASTLIAAAGAIVGAWLHWLRFRVPITVAAGMAAIGNAVLSLLFWAVPSAQQWVTTILLLCGCAVFATAMAWDRSDTKRQTSRSDVAFWLHLLAAPLLVHPVFSLLGITHGEVHATQTIVVVVLYLVIAIVSLSIDRRALMVSALAYVLYALTSLLHQTGIVSLSFAITALAIGSALLVLSAFWHRCRRVVVARLPQAWQAQLPPI